MSNNWLIRYQQGKIEGPYSADKIQDYIRSNKLAPDDEVSQENGYWIFIKERDLLQEFLFNKKSMGFNPVCDLDSVIAKEKSLDNTLDDITVISKLPTGIPSLLNEEEGGLESIAATPRSSSIKKPETTKKKVQNGEKLNQFVSQSENKTNFFVENRYLLLISFLIIVLLFVFVRTNYLV